MNIIVINLPADDEFMAPLVRVKAELSLCYSKVKLMNIIAINLPTDDEFMV